ncbi:MAG TPA: O-antigen ligase family protein [Rhodanobacteraceae bacterium]|nr:O-antigen ligase family protein [Rhodanobacteraceae bacterium]
MSQADASHRRWRRPSFAVLVFPALAFQAFFAVTHFGHGLRPEYGGTLALIVLAVAGGRRWRALVQHPVFWLVLAFTVYAVLQAAQVAQMTPGVPWDKHLSKNAELVRVGVLACVIGVCLAEQPQRIPHLLGLMVAGFLCAALVYAPWSDLGAVAAGALRLRFHYAENIVGEYAAIGLLLLSMYAMSQAVRGRVVVLAGLVVAGLLLLACLLYAQSRAAWLAAAVLIPATAIAHARDASGHWRRPVVIVIGITAIVVAVALGAGYGLVSHRLAGGQAIVEALANGDPATLPQTSATVRVQLALLGLHLWNEHPLLGIGLHDINPTIAASGIHIGDYVPPHLHNAYLQAAVGLGSVGAALLLATFGLLIRGLWLARRVGAAGSALYWSLLGSLGIVLVVNFSDCLLWRFDYVRAPLELLLGACLALSLRRRGTSVAAGSSTAADAGTDTRGSPPVAN